MSLTIGAGDFIFWEGGCMLIGKSANMVPTHAHYAIQIAFGTEPGIRFSTSDEPVWESYGAAAIPSRQPHMMDATVVPYVAVLLIEPETPGARAIAARYLADGIVDVIDDDAFITARDALFATWHRHGNADETKHAAQDVIDSLSQGAKATVLSDERIIRATTYIRSHLDRTLTLEEVAREACLSPSRFRHLFVEQTGTALRPYVLWRRFLRSWEVVQSGGSLSTAAHSAGFADAAHLTRTCHRMFGFPPSALQVNEKH